MKKSLEERGYDNLDRAILEELQANGRISVADLARKIHLSQPAVPQARRDDRRGDHPFLPGAWTDRGRTVRLSDAPRIIATRRVIGPAAGFLYILRMVLLAG